MKALLTKEITRTVVIEVESAKINHLFKGMHTFNDFEKACRENKTLELSVQADNFRATDEQSVKQLLETVDTVAKFLRNQYEDVLHKRSKQ